jgi:hypothetical protein
MQRLIQVMAGMLLVLALAACGGGGGSDAGSPATASRIEAGPAAVLLGGSGASRTLSAQLFDAAGAPGARSMSTSMRVSAACSTTGARRSPRATLRTPASPST